MGTEEYRWSFPEENLKDFIPTDYDNAVFHITTRTFKDDLYGRYLAEVGFPQFEDWAANSIGTHVRKIEIGKKTIEKPDEIMSFILNMESRRGYMLQLAIMQDKGVLDKGLVKN